MVRIIKKGKNESVEDLLGKVAALMINMEYGMNIYDISANDIKRNNNPNKKFNLVEYEFFTDVYTFNCGSIIMIYDADQKHNTHKEYEKLVEILKKHVKKLDCYQNTNVCRPFTHNHKFPSTQYTALWANISNGATKRKIEYHEKNPCLRACTEDRGEYDSFIWNVSPPSSLNINNVNYEYSFRSLSTIIVDMEDIIKYDENMKMIDTTEKIIVNYNYPIINQLHLNDKRILNTQLFIKQSCGIEYELCASKSKRTYQTFSSQFHKVYFTEYCFVCLCSAIKTNSMISNLTCETVISSRKKPTAAEHDKLGDEMTDYDICTSCFQPLFGDFYIIEKKSNQNQFAVCKICVHYTDLGSLLRREKSKVTILRSKMPRTINQAIDLMDKPSKISSEDYLLYKFALKTINKLFPKKLDKESVHEVENIPLNDDIILCANMANIWKNIKFIRDSPHKLFITIELS